MEFEHVFKEDDAGQREPREPRRFKIEMQPTGEREIDLNALNVYCQRGGSSTSLDIPSRGIQALDIALKHSASSRLAILRNESLYIDQRLYQWLMENISIGGSSFFL